MQKIQFIGRVSPSAIKITASAPELKWKWEEQGTELTFRVKIGNSIVNVECELETFKPEYITELHRRALDLACALVNLVAFAHGVGLSVVLEALIAPDGSPTEIVPIDASLPPLVTAYSLDATAKADFDAILNAVITSPDLFMALGDLIQAITLPHVSPVNCARAVDRIKHLIASPGVDDAQAWKQMREALQMEETYLKFITDVSKNPRHGRRGHTPGAQTTEAARRTWSVMNRYLEYIKRGRKALPVDKFSLLK
jgi:hypothetical protein